MEKTEKLPKWIESSLQGITYWIGHRRCIWPHYPLPEAALVAELCNLISAHLEHPQKLKCEVLYKDILGTTLTCASPHARADLVVFHQENEIKMTDYIIEVKRAGITQTSRNLLHKDLARLSEAHSLMNGETRALLFAICERELPSDFVDEYGDARRGLHSIDNCSGKYRVRRALKAIESQNIEKGHYACAIEVGFEN